MVFDNRPKVVLVSGEEGEGDYCQFMNQFGERIEAVINKKVNLKRMGIIKLIRLNERLL